MDKASKVKSKVCFTLNALLFFFCIWNDPFECVATTTSIWIFDNYSTSSKFPMLLKKLQTHHIGESVYIFDQHIISAWASH